MLLHDIFSLQGPPHACDAQTQCLLLDISRGHSVISVTSRRLLLQEMSVLPELHFFIFFTACHWSYLIFSLSVVLEWRHFPMIPSGSLFRMVHSLTNAIKSVVLRRDAQHQNGEVCESPSLHILVASPSWPGTSEGMDTQGMRAFDQFQSISEKVPIHESFLNARGTPFNNCLQTKCKKLPLPLEFPNENLTETILRGCY